MTLSPLVDLWATFRPGCSSLWTASSGHAACSEHVLLVRDPRKVASCEALHRHTQDVFVLSDWLPPAPVPRQHIVTALWHEPSMVGLVSQEGLETWEEAAAVRSCLARLGGRWLIASV